MKKIFISGEQINENEIVVEFQHFLPEHLTQDVLDTGYLVDSAPNPADIPREKGFSHRTIYNFNEKTFRIDRYARALTQEEIQQENNDKIDLILEMLLLQQGVIN